MTTYDGSSPETDAAWGACCREQQIGRLSDDRYATSRRLEQRCTGLAGQVAAKDEEIKALRHDCEQAQRNCSNAIEDYNDIKERAEAMHKEMTTFRHGLDPIPHFAEANRWWSSACAYRAAYPKEPT